MIPQAKNNEISKPAKSGHFRSAAKSFLFFILVISLAGCASFEFAGRGPSAAAHHGPKSFINIPPKPAFTIWIQLRCLIGLEAPDPPAVDPALIPAVFKPETVEPDLALIRQPDPDIIQVTWIGHFSFLVQVDGLNILTNPVVSAGSLPFPSRDRCAWPCGPSDTSARIGW